MSEIHYFPRYSQPENVVTNNTLLLLLRLHHYNRLKFQRFMERLCIDEETELAASWLQFSQQRGSGKSVVDGYIAQESLKIAVETKLGDGFGIDQLRNHLAIFGNEDHKLLIMLGRSITPVSRHQHEDLKRDAKTIGITIVLTTFEQVIDTVRTCLSEHDEEMIALVDDFEAFCSDLDLLPRDQYTMFVPPCGKSFEDNEEFQLYYCPVGWSRRSVAYLGVYARKSVRAIGSLAKVVACNVKIDERKVEVVDGSEMLTIGEAERILGATRKASQRGWDLSTGHKFFLCGQMEPTDFRKTSSGGIMGHRYLDIQTAIGTKLPADLIEIADRLRRSTWV